MLWDLTELEYNQIFAVITDIRMRGHSREQRTVHNCA